MKRITRREFLKYAVGGTFGLGASALGGSFYVTRVEPFTVEVTRVEVPLPRLPEAFAGTTIVQISDLHLGEWMKPEQQRYIVEQVNGLDADLVVITGDLVSALDVETPGELETMLRSLRAKTGVFAILGNHDYWTNPRIVSDTVIASGVRLLRNENVRLERDGAALYLAGLDDVWEGANDLASTLNGIPVDAAVVLLVHEPDYADRVAQRYPGRVGLQLSGHSHGGQVRLPFIGSPVLPYLGQKYPHGLYRVGEMALYTNRGVGMVKPYVRFGCPPEITHITLV